MNVIGYTKDGTIQISINGEDWFVPDDMGNRHRQMVAEWEADGNTIPAFTPPAPLVPDGISRRQFFQELANRGMITKAEALTAVTPGTLPTVIEALVSQILDEEIEWQARMLFAGAQTFNRSNGFVEFFGAMKDMSVGDIDQLWRDASILD
jgi:hypothetical protein